MYLGMKFEDMSLAKLNNIIILDGTYFKLEQQKLYEVLIIN